MQKLYTLIDEIYKYSDDVVVRNYPACRLHLIRILILDSHIGFFESFVGRPCGTGQQDRQVHCGRRLLHAKAVSIVV